MTTVRRDQYQWAARGFVAPGVLLIAVLLYVPLLWTIYLSLTEYDGLGNPEWVGFDNYVEMFQDAARSGRSSTPLLWVVGTLLIPVGIGLLVAAPDLEPARWRLAARCRSSSRTRSPASASA